MTMDCRGCGSKDSFTVRTRYDGEMAIDDCDHCGSFSVAGVPDVYFKQAYFDQNLGEDSPGKYYGQRVESKEHKKSLMRKLGVRESGDRVRGAR